jgi:hypothetical protein
MSIQVRPQPQANGTAAISSSWFLNSSSRSVALWLTSPVALGRHGTRRRVRHGTATQLSLTSKILRLDKKVGFCNPWNVRVAARRCRQGQFFREVAPRGTSAKHNRFTPYEVDVANVAPYASAGVRV